MFFFIISLSYKLLYILKREEKKVQQRMPCSTQCFAVFLFSVEAGGKGPFPYKAVSKGTKNITVSGLPHPFKRPYSLGAKQLRDILNRSDDITVHIDEGKW